MMNGSFGKYTTQQGQSYRFSIIDIKTQSVDSFKDSPCFSSSTPISTPSGEVQIQDIQAGDSVLAFDGFGELTACRVVNLQRNATDKWIALNYGDVSLKATPNHRMFTPAGEFATLESLMQGKEAGEIELVTHDGKTISVSFKTTELTTPETTYNFEAINFANDNASQSNHFYVFKKVA